MTFEYPAIFSRQRRTTGTTLSACFTAPVGEIRQFTGIERLTTSGKGHQRLRNGSKIKAISRYLDLDPRNTIPTALTIALSLPDFDEAELDGCSTLCIPSVSPPAGKVIDGQHRLFGIDDFDSDMRVNVVALINPEDEEIAFQFLVINQKVTKVPTDHLTLLTLNYSEEALGERLRSARLALGPNTSLVGVVDDNPDSPFMDAIIWPTETSHEDAERKDLVRPASVAQALSAISQKNLPDLDGEDALLEFFFTLWSTVRDKWPQLWHSDSRLLSKVGVVTLTTFVIDDLAPLADRGTVNLSEPSEIEKEVAEILSDLKPDFWTAEWTSTSLDTSAGRRLVIDDLIQMRRNTRREQPWHTDLSLVGSGPSND